MNNYVSSNTQNSAFLPLIVNKIIRCNQFDGIANLQEKRVSNKFATILHE